jgi:hypothetical protein
MTSWKYKAFISYSHADEADGQWLQRALEGFRVPSALVGRATAAGEVPKRLTPVFRDRDDLPAAGNLNAEIQAALAESQFQIVLCSPNAAKSRWVNDEITLFKKLHGAERTLAVIVAGEPGASTIQGREDEECFPPALRFRFDDKGEFTDEPHEPIAADARDTGDGRRYAILKLAAGLIGVRLDDLVQRDAQRRARTAWAWSGGSMAVAAVTGVLAVVAVDQSREANRMRGKAEHLIEFMLTELRDKIEPIGRTDVLEAVGKQALDYYESEEETELDSQALLRRARSLALVGEIHMRRNSLESALAAFTKAAAASGELLERSPNDQQLIFDHAQSVFYIGEIASNRGDRATFEKRMLDYLGLAERLVALDPKNPKWRLELAYGTSNIGSLKFYAGDYAASVPYFEESAAARRELLAGDPKSEKLALDYAYALSWIANAKMLQGDLPNALSALGEQTAIYQRLLSGDPDNFNVLDPLVVAERRIGESLLGLGKIDESRAAYAAAKTTIERLRARDSVNAGWTLNASHIERALSSLAGFSGDEAASAAAAERAIELAREVSNVDASNIDAQFTLILGLARRIAAGGDERELRRAETALRASLDLAKLDSERAAAALGEAALQLARLESRAGREDAAQGIRKTAIAQMSSLNDKIPAQTRLILAQLMFEGGDIAAARAQAAKLEAIGLRHPYLATLQEDIGRIARN